MLTAEQRALRLSGIGASEGAKVVGLSPYGGGPLGVWLEKPTPTRPPLIEQTDDEESPAQEVGTALEGGLRALAEKRTGVAFATSTTLVHPELPHILATPDGLALEENSGLELKLVGSRMAHHWDDGVPDYVLTQAVQGMAVTGRERWYVGALVGGSDFRIYQVLRDLEFEETLLEALTLFWRHHVEGDVAPEATDPDQHQQLLRLRFPGAAGETLRQLGDGEHGEVAELVRWLLEAKRQAKLLELAEAQLTNALCIATGEDYGVEGPWGKFLWIPNRGSVAWKRVAEEMGAIPTDLLEKHRGEPFRSPRLYPWKPKAEKASRKRTR